MSGHIILEDWQGNPVKFEPVDLYDQLSKQAFTIFGISMGNIKSLRNEFRKTCLDAPTPDNIQKWINEASKMMYEKAVKQ